MADFLRKHYDLDVSRFTIGRIIKRVGWTKKATQNVAKERSQDLRDDYIERRSHYRPEQMIFIDESGCDRGVALLGRGYARIGVTPVQIKRFHRGKRVQVLPAYTVDGVIYCEVYEDNTDVDVVEQTVVAQQPPGRARRPKRVVSGYSDLWYRCRGPFRAVTVRWPHGRAWQPATAVSAHLDPW